MSALNLYLIRHGETEYNRLDKLQGRGVDTDLNETGLGQARAVARYLEPIIIQKIYSSSLKRSKQTADIIAETKKLEIESYADLDEMGFGILEGRVVNEVSTELNHLHQTWSSGDVQHAMKEGESPAQVLARAEKKVLELIEHTECENILFVLHGRLIRILLSHWLEEGLQNMHKIKHSNGAIYHLRWDGKTFEDVLVHYTDHLKEIAG